MVGLFDDLAGACVELLEVSAAGLMLVDPAGRLRVMASSSERSRLLEPLEIQNEEGPCLDCYRGGQPILVADLAVDDGRWPTFAPKAWPTSPPSASCNNVPSSAAPRWPTSCRPR